MTEKKVGVKLTYTESGGDKARANTQKLADAFSKTGAASTALDKGMVRAAKQTATLAAGLGKVNKALKDMGELSGLADMKRDLADTTKEVERLTAQLKKKRSVEEEAERKQANRRGFTMGVAQGLGVGEYFPEKGLRANLAGRMAGGAARWAGGALATPLTGTQGLTQTLAGIPGIGGMLAGQLQMGLGYAQQALAAKQQTLGLAQFGALNSLPGAGKAGDLAAAKVVVPFANKAESQRLAKEAGERARQASLAGETGSFSERTVQAIAAKRRGDLTYDPESGADFVGSGNYTQDRASAREMAAKRAEIAKQESQVREEMQSRRGIWASQAGTQGEAAEYARQKSAQKDAVKRQNAARHAAAHAYNVANNPLAYAVDTGVQYGMDPTKGREALGQFLQASGGMVGDLKKGGRSRSMFDLALAGQTKYGVGMETAAAFDRAGITGAAAPGAGDQAYVRTLQNAFKLGLNNSDIAKYAEQTAAGIMEFEQNGLPLAAESSMDMARYLQGSVGGVRANSMAQDMVGAARRVAQGGVQTASDMMLLQEMGGYQGGGFKEYLDAQSQLERGGKAGGFKNLLERFKGQAAKIRGNDPDYTAAVILKALQGYGVKTSVDEVRSYLGNGDPEKLKQWQEQAAGGNARAGQTDTAEKITTAARGVVAPELKRDAALRQLGEELGNKYLPAAQALEQTTANMAFNFAEFSGYLTNMTSWMEKESKELGPMFDKMKSAVDALAKMAH